MPILGSPALTEAERQQLLLKERSLPYGQPRPLQTAPAGTPEQAINAKLASGQPLDMLDYIFISKNYPQVSAQMKATQTREEQINRKLASGEPFDIFEAITLSHYAPSTARTMALIERTNLDLASGKTLDIFEAIAVSKYAPNIATQLNTMLTELKTTPTTPPTPKTPHGAEVSGREAGMLDFSSTLTPTNLSPLAETQTQTVTIGKGPTSAGRQVTIQRQPILEAGPTLTGWLLGRSEEAKKAEQFLPSGVRTSKGLEAAAGFAFAGESLVNPRTPFKLSGPFIGGLVVGTVAIGYGVGKVIEPITQPYQQAIQAKGSAYLTKQYEEAAKSGNVLNWKGIPEKIVERLTGATPKELPPELVGLPTLEEGQSLVPSITKLSPSWAKYDVGMDILDLTNAPRVSGYGLTQAIPVDMGKLAETPAWIKMGIPAETFYKAVEQGAIKEEWFKPKPTSEQQPYTMYQGGHAVDISGGQQLSFSKLPQTFRPAQTLPLAFTKQVGALPTAAMLLPPSTVKEVAMLERSLLPASLLLFHAAAPSKVEYKHQVNVLPLASGITPGRQFTPKQAPQQLQVSQQIEDIELVGSPTDVLKLTREIQQPTRKEAFSPLLNVPTQVSSKQRSISTPSLGINLIPNVIVSPGISPIVDVGLTSKTIVTPMTDVLVTPKTKLITTPTTPLLQIPKSTFVFPRSPFQQSSLMRKKKKQPSSMEFLFGRQPRKYPIMSGREAARFLFPEAQRRKRKR